MGLNSARVRKNSKLESFLKRNLNENVFDDIRWYENVIVKKRGTLAYKNLVVTSDRVFVTDAPPKHVSLLFATSDIVSVEIIHDVPEFLPTEYKDQTTHIQVQLQRPNESLLDKHRGLRNITPRNFYNSNTLSKPDVIKEEDERPKSGKRKEDKNSENKKSVEDLSLLSDFPRKAYFSPHLRTFASRSLDNVEFFLRSKSRSASSSPTGNSRLLESDVVAKLRKNSIDSINGFMTFPRRHGSPAGLENILLDNSRTFPPDLQEQSNVIEFRSMSALEHCERSPVPQSSLALRSRSVLDTPVDILGLQRRSVSMGQADFPFVNEETNKEVIHLYTLSTSTALFNLLQSLWTMNLMSESCKGLREQRVNKVAEEEPLAEIFYCLRTNTLTAKSLPKQIALLADLQNSARKYNSVRRIFWKEGDMVESMRQSIKRYSSLSARSTNDDHIQDRQDELEVLDCAVDKWLSFALPQMLQLLHPSKDDHITAEESVFLYQFLHILHMFVLHCPKASETCKVYFWEEIRYYTQENVVSCCLLSSYPLYPKILELAATVNQCLKI